MKVFEEFAGEVIKHAIQEQESSSSIYYEELIRTGVTVLQDLKTKLNLFTRNKY